MLAHCSFSSLHDAPTPPPLQDMLVRKKQALHLSGQYVSMIDNAVYYSNPPAVTQVRLSPISDANIFNVEVKNGQEQSSPCAL